MAKESFYFSHDYGARNDPRLLKVKLKLGHEGKSVYWDLVEMLYEEGGFLQLSDLDIYADVLKTSIVLIENLINEFNLFQKNDEKFWSDSVLRRLNKRDEIRFKNRENGQKGGRPKNPTETEQKPTGFENETEKNQRKGKEKKEKEIKEKEEEKKTSSSDFLKTSDKAGFVAKIRQNKDFNEKVSETCPLDCDLESYYDSLCMNSTEALIHQALSSYMTGKFPKFGISAAGFQKDFANWLAQEKPKKVEKPQQDGMTYPKFKPQMQKKESPLDLKTREEAIEFLKNLPKRMRRNQIPLELIEKWKIDQQELEGNETKASNTS